MQTGILTRAATEPLMRSRAAEITIWIAAFAVATALSAQIRIPLPFTPVPLTLQAFFVLLAGVVLGPGWGTLSMGIYLSAGMVGLPIFSGGGSGLVHLTNVTAGYLLAFPVATYLAGTMIGRMPTRARIYPALLIAGLLILAMGTAWIALLLGLGPREAAAAGFWPFIIGDLIKTAAAAELGLLIGRRG